MNVVFWNLMDVDLTGSVARLARTHECDLLVLAEAASLGAGFEQTLRTATGRTFHRISSLTKSLRIFAAFPDNYARSLAESDRVTIQHISLPGLLDFNLVALHLPSRQHMTSESQSALFFELSADIRKCERRVGHRRTIVVGDLNANPFSPPVVSAAGLHAVMSRRIASRGKRKVQGREYPIFYNPMWSLLGREDPGPPGSFFRSGSEDVEYFWHMLDQVLIRPDLLDRFPLHSLQIVTSDGQESLVDSAGKPRKKSHSDHLPLAFELLLETDGVLDARTA